METTSLPNVLKGKKVLELGVGNGKTLRAILKQKPARADAVDFSETAVQEAKIAFMNDNVVVIKADVTQLPFENGEFDDIVCYYILNNLLEKGRERAISEMYRVLNKEGKILFEDFSEGDFREKEGSESVENNTLKNKAGIICHFFNVKELKGLFEDFKSSKFAQKTSTPITHKPELKREIISGIITK